ncbi:Alpha/Beta hydrolase protein [Gigaspora rosea]|uniref:Alpha/Beta hydrolase protein n=1 Tax=Gigaspora rosea TaxID=44941 RepID=A0A397UQE0_9GLOM|nr:Alpha/Beta hydrolase protein [Gigaspora rosea]
MEPISFALIAAATTFTTGALLHEIQSNLIYPTKHRNENRHQVAPLFAEDGIPFCETTLTTEDNVKIRTYVCKPRAEKEAKKRPTILILHGNRGNTGYHSKAVSKFYHELKCNVVLPSYRGYDRSEGRPTEPGIKTDAQTFLDYIKRHNVLKNTKLIVYGRSLGGAVAIDLASKNEDKIDALIIENTFVSIPKLYSQDYYLYPLFSAFFTQTWSSEWSIGEIKTTPILFLSSGADRIVPQEHMKSLYELSKTTGIKKWMEFPNAKHRNTFHQPGFFEAIQEFLSKALAKK